MSRAARPSLPNQCLCRVAGIVTAVMLLGTGLIGFGRIDTYSGSSFQIAAAQSDNNSTSASGANDSDIEFASNVEMVKGHLAQALENKENGQIDLAQQEISESLSERYSAILEPRIQSIDASLNSAIKSALGSLDSNAGSMSVSDFKTQVQNIFAWLDQASSKVLAASERADPKFNASVAIAVVNRAAGEYTEAVTAEGKVDKQFEYQIAQAFAGRAESALNQTFFTGNSSVSNAQASITALFSQLRSSMQSVRDSAAIQSGADGIMTAIGKLAGLSPTTIGGSNSDSSAITKYVEKTRSLLKQAQMEYINGNYSGADNLATTAYLDNFENVEPELVKLGYVDLKSQTEQMMRIDLRQMINSKLPADQVTTLINSINVNLDRIITVVPEFPLSNGIAIVSAMTVAVLVSMWFRKGTRNL